jgi:dimethylamine/trimethylamine dehydrogenase
MGGILAELLAREGQRVTLVTPAAQASIFMNLTMEQRFVQRRLLELGVEIVSQRLLSRIGQDHVTTACAFTGHEVETTADAVVMVTARLPNDELFLTLREKVVTGLAGAIRSLRCVGDAWAPATIAHAVNAGRRYAEELEEDVKAYGDGRDFIRETTRIGHPAAQHAGSWSAV